MDGAYYTETTERRRIVALHAHLCAITDVGRERDHNEDTFALAEEGRLLVVADGLGGHAAGEVASALAVDTLIEYLAGERLNAVERGEAEIEKALIEAFEETDARVREAAQSGQGRQGMGTTLIAAFIRGDRLHTCHVGDVRCYVRNAEGLRTVTQDHSVVGLLMRAGQLTPEEARGHPEKATILQAIGVPMVLNPEVHSIPLHAGDLVLLCSDGLWEALSDEEINTILAWEGSMRQRATQLVEMKQAVRTISRWCCTSTVLGIIQEQLRGFYGKSQEPLWIAVKQVAHVQICKRALMFKKAPAKQKSY